MGFLSDTGGVGTKLRVSRTLGASSLLGYCDPQVGAPVYTNSVVSIGNILSCPSGNGTVIVGVGTGSFQRAFYPMDLYTTEAWATGVAAAAFPTGVGCVSVGHHGIWPNGVSVAVGTGMDYMGGDGLGHLFNRSQYGDNA